MIETPVQYMSYISVAGSIKGVHFTGAIRELLRTTVTAAGFLFEDGSTLQFDDGNVVEVA
jgi:hypothetical protein